MIIPHMPTVISMAILLSVVMGSLLISAAFQEGGVPALKWWGAATFANAGATSLLEMRGVWSDFATLGVANATLILCGGLMLTGARSFEGRSTSVGWLAAPPLGWIVLCQFEAINGSPLARVVITSLALATFCFLSSFELWRGRSEKLVSRTAAVIAFALLGAALMARAAVTAWFATFTVGSVDRTTNFGVIAIIAMVLILTLSFVLLALAKERAQSRYKRAALIDPLTEMLNRRGFFEETERRLRRRNRATALVLDLDHFKAINDTFGHLAGDKVLRVFAACVRSAVRPTDLVGRLGGEEFAVLLIDADVQEASEIAERIRREFQEASQTIEGHRVYATVSVGVAAAVSRDVMELLQAADAALYRAKADGRNCVRTAIAERGFRDAANVVPLKPRSAA